MDDLELAQFVYLLLHNPKIRSVIDTITAKAVLILGRFTLERKAVLDAIRDRLARENLVPIVVDFEQPSSRDVTETVSTLAHMSRFIIADIIDPRSILQELQSIVSHLPSVPVQPIIHRSASEYGMFEHFMSYPWVLGVFHYATDEEVLKLLVEKTIPEIATRRSA